VSSCYSIAGSYIVSRLSEGQAEYTAEQFLFPIAQCSIQRSYNPTKVNMDRASGVAHTLLEKKMFQLQRDRLVSRWLTSMFPNITTNISFCNFYLNCSFKYFGSQTR